MNPFGLSYGYRGGGIGLYVGPSYGYYRTPYYGYPAYGPSSSGIYYPPSYPYYAEPYPNYAQPYTTARPVSPAPYGGYVSEYPRAADANERAAEVPRSTSENLMATAPAAAGSQAAAEQALRAGRFESAVQSSIRATAADPDNGPLHLFQSLAFFAYGDYRSAADAIRRGLSQLEESEWGQVVEHHDSFYPHNDYQSQLDGLSASAQRNPTQFHLQFLAGYHQLYSGDRQMASNFLSKAAELEPADSLTSRLLELSAEALPLPPGLSESQPTVE